jgi:hypothetical protein
VANFLEALGDTLLAGSEMAGRQRAEKRLEEREAVNQRQQLLQISLMQDQAARQRALDILSAGPGASLGMQEATEVEKAGFGNRLAPAMAMAPQPTPDFQGPMPMEVVPDKRQILATPEQQMQLDAASRAAEMHGLQTGDLRAQSAERDRVNNLRAFINTPEFDAQPANKQQLIWNQAGLPGLPSAEVRERMKLEHDYRMKEIDAQGDNQARVADIRRAGTTKQMFDMVQRVQKDLADETGFATKLKQQFSLMEQGAKAIAEGKPNAGGQAVLTTFQKILDPESVVRESEYLRSAEGQSLRNQLRGTWERLTAGGTGVANHVLIGEYLALARQVVQANEAFVAAKQAAALAEAEYFRLPAHLIVPGAAPAGVQAQPGVINTNPPPGNSSPSQPGQTGTPGPKFSILGVQ